MTKKQENSKHTQSTKASELRSWAADTEAEIAAIVRDCRVNAAEMLRLVGGFRNKVFEAYKEMGFKLVPIKSPERLAAEARSSVGDAEKP